MMQTALRCQRLRTACLRITSTRSYAMVPRVARVAFWQSLIPKAFRERTSQQVPKAITPARPWNPATFFIVIFLLIGSNSINLMAVRKDALSFSRQADAKIAALRNAIERVQRGEDVDVKRLLGTGDPIAEAEWEDVLKELEQERPVGETKQDRKANRRAVEEEPQTKESMSQIGEEDEAWMQAKISR